MTTEPINPVDPEKATEYRTIWYCRNGEDAPEQAMGRTAHPSLEAAVAYFESDDNQSRRDVYWRPEIQVREGWRTVRADDYLGDHPVHPQLDPSPADLAAAAFSRSNELVDADVFDEVLAEIADKAAGTTLQWRTASRAGREHALPYPFAALSYLLAVTAALRAALGYTDTPTAAEVFEQAKATETHTVDLDMLRLHMLSEHADLNAPFQTDQEVVAAHEHEHDSPNAHRIHDRVGTHWDPTKIDHVLADVPDNEGHDAYRTEAARLIDRLGSPHKLPPKSPWRQTPPATTTREHDALRLHLLHVHGKKAGIATALTLGDTAAQELHTHLHSDPSIDHPADELRWDAASIIPVIRRVWSDDDSTGMAFDDQDRLLHDFAGHYARATGRDVGAVVGDLVAHVTTGVPLPADGPGRSEPADGIIGGTTGGGKTPPIIAGLDLDDFVDDFEGGSDG